MITAEKITKLGYLNTEQLDNALQAMGYLTTMYDPIMESKFLGITNGGDFCYQFAYIDSDIKKLSTGKLFVSVNETGTVVAEF